MLTTTCFKIHIYEQHPRRIECLSIYTKITFVYWYIVKNSSVREIVSYGIYHCSSADPNANHDARVQQDHPVLSKDGQHTYILT